MPELKRCDDSPSFGSLKAFELIGRLGGIRKAAMALGVDHAAVSRHLKSLEEWAGIPLLDRRLGENGKLTAKGALYHSRISAALCDINNACADLRQRQQASILCVWCPPALAYQWLMPRVQQFADAHEDMDLDLRVIDDGCSIADDDRSVRIDFICDGSSRGPSVGRAAREICRPVMIPVVSPGFLAHREILREVSEITRFPLLHEDAGNHWRRWLGGYGVPVPHDLRGPRLSHAHLTIDAAKRGQGVALAPDLLVADELAVGSLVEVKVAGRALPRTCLGAFVLSGNSNQWDLPAMSMLRRWLMEAMGATCSPDYDVDYEYVNEMPTFRDRHA